MRVTVDIPDSIASSIAAEGQEAAQTLLEAIAVDAYHNRKLSEEQVRVLLGYETRMEVHDLLSRHNVYLQYDRDDLAHDIAASENPAFQRGLTHACHFGHDKSINYLVLISHEWLLERLYRQILLPHAVRTELLASRAPARVRQWAQNLPAWVDVRSAAGSPNAALNPELGAGEREALALALENIPESYLLIDEKLGRAEAARLGIPFTGTLGTLRQAHLAGLIDLQVALNALRQTSFKVDPKLVQQLLRSVE